MSYRSHPQTIAHEVTVQGHGLHSGRPSRVTIRPAERASGVRFVHIPTGVEIPAKAEFVGDLSLATTLVRNGIRLGTIEHLLSALMGLEIEHAVIEVDGEELPILDGSARGWVRALGEAGVRELAGSRRVIRMLRSVEIREGSKWMRITPYRGFRIRYSIDFDHPAIGRQSRELTLTPDKYRREVSSARTFCMEQDIAYMQSRGLALGGSLENAVVFSAQGPLNDALRFEDEAVRHKMLDLVGDLAMLGAPLEGLVEAHAAGHAMHIALVRAILDDPSAWTWAESGEVRPAAGPLFRTLPSPSPLHA